MDVLMAKIANISAIDTIANQLEKVYTVPVQSSTSKLKCLIERHVRTSYRHSTLVAPQKLQTQRVRCRNERLALIFFSEHTN